MPSEKAPKSIDAYIAGANDTIRPICEKLAALIRKAAPGLREELKWNSPVWSGQAMVCGLGAFKAHAHLHFFKGSLLPDPDGLLIHGEGNASSRSIKFSDLADIPTKALEKLIRTAVKIDADGDTKAAPKPKRVELPLPDDLATAIRADKKAQENWDTLPPSCRREYIEWITTAKREETRTRRLAEAVTMLQSGRRRNEQYR